MGSTSNAIFTGNSQFSLDLQNVVTRAVNLASLPITQLNNQKTALTNQSTALSGLDASFVVLQSAVTGIANAFGGSSLQASVSDTSKVSVALGSGATEGTTYSINISNPGTYATSITASNWDAAASHVYTLSLNGSPLALTVSDNSAGSLVAAINSQYGDQVSATVVNVSGSDTSPDYRISLQARQLGNLDPQILRDGVSITDPGNKVTGVLAQYTINNSNNAVTSSSRTVSLGNGMTASLLGATGTVTITVTRPALRSEQCTLGLRQRLQFRRGRPGKAARPDRRGPGGRCHRHAALASDPRLGNLRSSGRHGAGADGPRTRVGLRWSLYLQPVHVHRALHPELRGRRFVLRLTDHYGILKGSDGRAQHRGADRRRPAACGGGRGAEPDQKTSNQIDTQQARVDQLQLQMNQQMAAADALISSMEQQYNYVTGMFQAMQTAAQQYK